jgi:hypothetical protein
MNVSEFCPRLSSTTIWMIDIPVLVMHGEDHQICPFPTTGARSVKLLKHGTLKSYPGLPYGMPTTPRTRSTPIRSPSFARNNHLCWKKAGDLGDKFVLHGPLGGSSASAGEGKKNSATWRKRIKPNQRSRQVGRANRSAQVFKDAARFETGGVRYHISADR